MLQRHCVRTLVPSLSQGLEPQGLGYVGIWAPFQGTLGHFLETFKHTEVVRWGRPVEAQPCWEPSIASEETRQPAALERMFSQFCL